MDASTTQADTATTSTPKTGADDQAERAARWVFSPVGRLLAPIRSSWRDKIVEDIDHKAVVAKVALECPADNRYYLLILMSAGIAILGLLLSSAAVVIGAMLLSPMLSPILGVGFALATGKQKWLRISARTVALGSIAAVLFSALIVVVSPLEAVTAEIASRTRPNLLDFLVALFSSIAGSYAMIRGREGTIVGVAIATALMPPLAVIGFGLATLNWTIFFGALGLFVTNFLTIALTATLMARLYGFRTTLSKRQGWFQNFGIFAIFIAMAIPLGLSLRQIAWEANSQRIVRNAIQAEFGERARISEQVIDWSAAPLSISATVLTPDFDTDANLSLQSTLTEQLGREVAVNVEQFRYDGTDPNAAEQAELSRARAAERAAATERQINAMIDRMAVAAGVNRSNVMVDRDTRRITADAMMLEGLSLDGYRELESRVAAGTPGWTVNLRPLPLLLPAVTLRESEPDEAGRRAEETVTWAARRVGLPLIVIGPEGQAEAFATRLRTAGVRVSSVQTAETDRIETRWAALPQ